MQECPTIAQTVGVLLSIVLGLMLCGDLAVLNLDSCRSVERATRQKWRRRMEEGAGGGGSAADVEFRVSDPNARKEEAACEMREQYLDRLLKVPGVRLVTQDEACYGQRRYEQPARKKRRKGGGRSPKKKVR